MSAFAWCQLSLNWHYCLAYATYTNTNTANNGVVGLIYLGNSVLSSSHQENRGFRSFHCFSWTGSSLSLSLLRSFSRTSHTVGVAIARGNHKDFPRSIFTTALPPKNAFCPTWDLRSNFHRCCQRWTSCLQIYQN